MKSVIYIFAYLLVSALPLMGATKKLTNHNAPIYYSVEDCLEGMRTLTAWSGPNDLKNQFELICWNIEKGKNPGWKEELRSIAKTSQIVLLQEAIFVDEMKHTHNPSWYWSFAPGYKTNAHSSGVMTISKWPPTLFCTLEVTEPWLRSPKQTNIVQLPLGEEHNSLLLVNMHAINFTFGVKAYQRQLQDVGRIINAHSGPVVFSGDLNTWTESRNNTLLPFVEQFGLQEVTFNPDHRSKKMGHPVDFIFIRGLEVKEARVIEVDTSDHNPLVVTLAGKPNESIGNTHDIAAN